MKRIKNFYYKVRKNQIDKLKDCGFNLYLSDVSTSNEHEVRVEEYWAITIRLRPDSIIGNWMKQNLELIYKKGGQEWHDNLLKEGYVFDEEGNLDTFCEQFTSGLNAQVCVCAKGQNVGLLFINIEGTEFYDTKTISDAAPKLIVYMLANKIITEKKDKKGYKNYEEN